MRGGERAAVMCILYSVGVTENDNKRTCDMYNGLCHPVNMNMYMIKITEPQLPWL